jgi:hypothetical protein
MPFHPAADLFPLLEGKEYEELRADIMQRGLLVPIWTYDKQIIDGRNRYRVCQELGITPEFKEWDGGDSLVAFIISLNVKRRHLNESQRATVAAKATELFAEEARQRMLAGKKADPAMNPEQGRPGRAAAKAAEMMNVGVDTVYKGRKVRKKGAPGLEAMAGARTVSLSAAYELTELPRAEQEEVLARGPEEVKARAKEIRLKKKADAQSSKKSGAGKAAPGLDPATTPETTNGAAPDSVLIRSGDNDRTIAEQLIRGLGEERAARVRDALTDALPGVDFAARAAAEASRRQRGKGTGG